MKDEEEEKEAEEEEIRKRRRRKSRQRRRTFKRLTFRAKGQQVYQVDVVHECGIVVDAMPLRLHQTDQL